MSLREAKKLRARHDILTAARELIDTHGYEQTTMRDIATAAELSYQTLYNYFPTKALILQALLLEDDLEFFKEAAEELEKKTQDPETAARVRQFNQLVEDNRPSQRLNSEGRKHITQSYQNLKKDI